MLSSDLGQLSSGRNFPNRVSGETKGRIAMGLSCPSLSAPSLAIRAMIGCSPCGHLSYFSTLLRIS
eukprot:780069-Heterocapsa_arctica.AAC.1